MLAGAVYNPPVVMVPEPLGVIDQVTADELQLAAIAAGVVLLIGASATIGMLCWAKFSGANEFEAMLKSSTPAARMICVNMT